MNENIELHFVTHITVGAIGSPGQRVFLLQASDALRTVTLKIEKEHAQAIAETGSGVIKTLEDFPEIELIETGTLDHNLREPTSPLFTVQQVILGYDGKRDRIMLELHELVEDEETKEDGDTARFWISRMQLQSLCEQASKIVGQGRPSPRLNSHHRYPI